MKILGIGETVIDTVLLTHNGMGDTVVDTQQHIGGPVPAALILLSRLGMECTLMTSLGKDKNAIKITKTLKKEKVQLIKNLQEKTKTHTIIVNSSTGHREKQRENNIHKPITNIAPKFLQQFDLILMDRHEKEAFKEVILKKKTKTKLIVDTSIEISDTSLEMLRNSDFPILPIEALAKIDSKKDLLLSLKKLQKICNKPIIVTVGELGSVFFNNGKLKIIPSLSIKSIDTTGAGDIFRGAFAFGLLNNWKIEKILQFANLVAGIQCTKIGNVAAIPTKDEIELCKNLVLRKKIVRKDTINNYFLNLNI